MVCSYLPKEPLTENLFCAVLRGTLILSADRITRQSCVKISFSEKFHVFFQNKYSITGISYDYSQNFKSRLFLQKKSARLIIKIHSHDTYKRNHNKFIYTSSICQNRLVLMDCIFNNKYMYIHIYKYLIPIQTNI